MKNIIALSLLGTLVVLFTACGGGSDAHFRNANIIPIDVNCTTPATISTYITLQSDDVIVKEENNTTISIYHDINLNKKVCLVSGKAYIIRK